MTRDISYFPIGTVVVLKDSTAATVISGYLAENDKMPGYTWDYSGFLYPIGLRDENEVYTFDHSQIEQVLAIGYQDGECFAFMNKLREVAGEMAGLDDAKAAAMEKAEEEDGNMEEDAGQITSEETDKDQ